jgi:hypothetical protein
VADPLAVAVPVDEFSAAANESVMTEDDLREDEDGGCCFVFGINFPLSDWWCFPPTPPATDLGNEKGS